MADGRTVIIATADARQNPGQARLVLGHIGDSRCYRLRDNTLQQATRDHSLLQEQLDAGLITSEQAAVAAHHNLITRALGVELGVQLEVNEYKVAANDLYLMCSDGLSDMVDDHTIAAILARSDSLASRAQALVDAQLAQPRDQHGVAGLVPGAGQVRLEGGDCSTDSFCFSKPFPQSAAA